MNKGMQVAWLQVTLEGLARRSVEGTLSNEDYIHLVKQAVYYCDDTSVPNARIKDGVVVEFEPHTEMAKGSTPIFSGTAICDNYDLHESHQWRTYDVNFQLRQYQCLGRA